MNMSFGERIKKLVMKRPDSDTRRDKELVDGGRRHGESENPWLSARRTWNDIYAASAASRQMWQVVAMAALLLMLASVGGMIHIGSQSKFVPYIVQVDKLGQVVAVAPAQRTTAADPAILRASVAAWISDVRLVTPDVSLQRKAVFRVYAMLAPNDPATAKTNEWLNGTDSSSPFKRAEKELVSVEIETVLAQTPDTYQVDWIETTRDRQGVLKSKPQRWRALLTVYTVPAGPEKTEQEMNDNPLGIHLRDFAWSKQL
ncbi:VirB8/TrbF family protein [Massilia soli]|nr:VirB8/TrbF family protein [Massilia soli]